MKTKEAIQRFLTVIVGCIVASTVMSFEIKVPRYEWIMYFLLFGQGIIAGYLYTQVVKELKNLFDLQ